MTFNTHNSHSKISRFLFWLTWHLPPGFCWGWPADDMGMGKIGWFTLGYHGRRRLGDERIMWIREIQVNAIR